MKTKAQLLRGIRIIKQSNAAFVCVANIEVQHATKHATEHVIHNHKISGTNSRIYLSVVTAVKKTLVYYILRFRKWKELKDYGGNA